MTKGWRIKALREQMHMTQSQLAEKIGSTKQTIYKYESGLVTNIPSNKFEAIASALGTTPAALMGWESSIPAGFQPMPTLSRLPRVGQIACGQPITAEENLEGYDDVPSRWHGDFTLVCKGDSMLPRIQDNDIVVIKKQSSVENGEIAAIRIDNEATLKHVYIYKNKVVLQPENPDYEPIVLIGEEINSLSIEGKAVGLCRGL